MSYLTDDEKARLQQEWTDLSATLGLANVSQTQFSIARHFGGIRFQGHQYVYFQEHDELWRDDVLKMVHGWRRTDAMAKELPGAEPPKNMELF